MEIKMISAGLSRVHDAVTRKSVTRRRALHTITTDAVAAFHLLHQSGPVSPLGTPAK